MNDYRVEVFPEDQPPVTWQGRAINAFDAMATARHSVRPEAIDNTFVMTFAERARLVSGLPCRVTPC